jgi:hypothetical protein
MLEVQPTHNESIAKATTVESNGGGLQIQQGTEGSEKAQMGHVSEIIGSHVEKELYQLQQKMGLFCLRLRIVT